MSAKTNADKTPNFGALECGFIAITLLVMMGVLGFLGNEVYSTISARRAEAEAADSAQVAKLDPARPGQAVTSAMKDQASSASTTTTPAASSEKIADEEAQETPTRSVRSVATLPASSVGLSLDPGLMTQAVLAAGIIMGLGVVAALVFAFCFMTLLRRHAREFGALIRIDCVGAQPLLVSSVVAATEPSPATPATTAPTTTAPTPVAPKVEENVPRDPFATPIVPVPAVRGPAWVDPFADHRQQLDTQAKRQEAAMLQQLCEDNLRMHAEIGQQRNNKT